MKVSFSIYIRVTVEKLNYYTWFILSYNTLFSFCTFQGLFWSLKFDMQTRLILVSTKPTPHARHIVLEPNRIRLDPSPVVDASNSGLNQNQQRHNNYAVTGK